MDKNRNMGKIQDKNIFYELIKWYAGKIFRSTYRKTEIRGIENIPENAAIIYAPNHTSGMTDALSMIFMDGKRKVFVARADIFRNPHVAKILYFFKLMPINRMRDGIRNMKNNGDTFEKAVDVLRDGVPFVIFPEGTRTRDGNVGRFKRGAFAIAADLHLPVVPITIKGAYETLPYHALYVRPGVIEMKIHKPINTSAVTHENIGELIAEAHEAIAAGLD